MNESCYADISMKNITIVWAQEMRKDIWKTRRMFQRRIIEMFKKLCNNGQWLSKRKRQQHVILGIAIIWSLVHFLKWPFWHFVISDNLRFNPLFSALFDKQGHYLVTLCDLLSHVLESVTHDISSSIDRWY